jgi:hypothetical protein
MKKVLLAIVGLALVQTFVTPARAAVDQDAINKAVNQGVEALRQLQRVDGTWPHQQIGATALAGLTLLECGAAADDKAVVAAANAVRRVTATGLTHTYSIALSILFLDRLGDPQDVPLIESLTVRLLAGQKSSNGWAYDCPPIAATESRRLAATLEGRKELAGRREPPKPGAPRRTVKDLPREIQEQLAQIDRMGGGGMPGIPGMGMSDNSNTQFATLALWVGRRHGLPVERALARVEARFRVSQGPDGGWGYLPPIGPMGGPQGAFVPSTASMTCAGLLGLAVARGAALEMKKPAGGAARDPGKDPSIKRALLALGSVIGQPIALRGPTMPRMMPGVPQVGGTSYYTLWSIERVAMALDLETIGKKDWYAWGVQVLLANQTPGGFWQGEYADCGADTCFALLFLKRANLARDLTSQFKGRLTDPGEAELKAGGIGGEGLTGKPRPALKSALDPKGAVRAARDDDPAPDKLRPPPSSDTETGRLAVEMLRASAEQQEALLEKMRDGKGAEYTEALSTVIPRLIGDSRKKARQALADRLTRMKPATLRKYLEDEDTEIRRAAALACAMKDHKDFIPDLIPLLQDSQPLVVRAAHAALKELSGQDFGPGADADREQRGRAMAAWREWWLKQKRE